MGLRVLRGGRRQIGDVNTYVGEFGTVFYDEDSGTLRLSDGVTPGGAEITPITIVSTTEPTDAPDGQLWYNPNTFELWAYHNGEFLPTIDLATDVKIGGVKLGPGVITNSEGQIIIDSTGLDFNFGDFQATTESGVDSTMSAVLSSINPDEPIIIRSNGTGSVSVIGEFNMFPTDGSIGDRNPAFSVGADGQITIRVPAIDAVTGAVEIIGSFSGASVSPVNTGVMLHITGNNNDASRLYNDGNNAFAAFVARRYNGGALAPTAVLDNEEIMRLSGTAHNGTSLPGTANQRITYRALGNQTLTNQGGSIEFSTTPLNSTTLTTVATMDNANGLVVTKATVTGNLIVGNISATGITGTLSNGNSNVSIAANGNVSISSTGNANVLVVTGTGANIAGTANISGNANIGNVGTGTIVATGNVTGGNLATNGSIRLQGSTSGNITLQANATAGTNTVTLPAATGTAVVSTAGANTVTGVLAGKLTVDPAAIGKNSASVQTFTITGLTTNHKVIITSGTALGYGTFVTAAWASAANTVSIEIQNIGGGIDLGNIDINYFAWL